MTLKQLGPIWLAFSIGPFSLLGQSGNLARLGHATAASVWHNSSDMTPEKGIDGKTDTRWSAEGRQSWYQIEWEKPQTICGAVLRNYDASWNKNIPFTCQAWVPHLNEGKGAFTNLQTIIPGGSTVVFEFPEVTTTKLRVTNVITFWELEVYNDKKILNGIAADTQRISLAASGDLRGHIVGSLSRENGDAPVVDGAISISGRSPLGIWRRETSTDATGLFKADLPAGSFGPIGIKARDSITATNLELDAGDIPQYLTPTPSAITDHLPLSGPWNFKTDPDSSNWSRINVPSHWEMEGFVASNGIAIYQREFRLPGAWRNKRIKFRAEGIYSKAEVWLNSHRLGSHDGGATLFELDATDAVRPGAKNTITIRVADHSDADDYSAMSFYAHMNLGGIWRPLEMFCVEPAHIERLALKTDLDAEEQDADLILDLNIANEQYRRLDQAKLTTTLIGPDGKKMAPTGLSTNFSLAGWENRPLRLTAKISSPEKWSAESPALYKLCLSFTAPGQAPAKIEQQFGFKEVKILGNTYLLNGQPVKFWGACRHDADPLAGRAISKETAWHDIELMKGANLNAMRTSHYPPNGEALKAADHLGIYVEDEAPFCWANAGWGGRTRNVVGDLRLAPLAIQLASELVERDRNHPCVSIWSVCNESAYGRNLDLVRGTIKESDASRPESAGQSANLDLATYHNPTSMQRIKDTATLPMPVLFDEGFCIFQGFGQQAQGLELDPGLRDYWVTVHFNPLQAMLHDNHYLGAMIWAWVDDAFLAPNRGYEYGRSYLPHAHIVDDVYGRPGRGIVGDPMWGIVDGWRRPRPEYWLTKKLFSPIQIREQPLVPSLPIEIPVENRNYFINLNQYACCWRIGNESGELRADVPPQKREIIEIRPKKMPQTNSLLTLEFRDGHQRLVDAYRLRFAPVPLPTWPATGKPGAILEQPPSLDGSSDIRLLGDQVELAFDRTSQHLSRGLAGNHQVLFDGPALHVMKSFSPLDNYPLDWQLTQSSYRTNGGLAILEWTGHYGSEFDGGFTISMDSAEHVEINYHFHHPGGEVIAREIGLTFEVPLSCDTLTWDRDAEWSYYPPDEIGRPSGTAAAHVRSKQSKPFCNRPFSQDDHAWGCNDFRSTKRNIYWASLTDRAGAGIRVISNGKQHVRATVGPRSIALHVLDYYGGSATGTPEWDDTYGVGRVVHTGETLSGTVRLELLPPNTDPGKKLGAPPGAPHEN